MVYQTVILARLFGFEGGSWSDLEGRFICREIRRGFTREKVLTCQKKSKKDQNNYIKRKNKSLYGTKIKGKKNK